MSERLKSMQRIVAMQAQRKRLAEWALAAAETRKASIGVARTELGTFVQDENLTGPLASLAMIQTRRLAEREAEAGAEVGRQRQAVQAAERRHRLAERLTEAVAADHRVEAERRGLEQLIESAVARDQQGAPD